MRFMCLSLAASLTFGLLVVAGCGSSNAGSQPIANGGSAAAAAGANAGDDGALAGSSAKGGESPSGAGRGGVAASAGSGTGGAPTAGSGAGGAPPAVGGAPAAVGGFGPDAIRVACVGDSITYGAGTTDHAVWSYPAQLQSMLGNSYHVENYGVNGSTVNPDEGYPTSDPYKQAHTFLPNIVIISLGTNDMDAFAFHANDKFVENYTNMVNSFKDLSTHPTIYMGLPPWVKEDDVQAQYTEDRLTTVIFPEIKTVATATGSTLIDFHSATINHPEIYVDKIHPNNEGCTVMATLVYNTLKGNK